MAPAQAPAARAGDDAAGCGGGVPGGVHLRPDTPSEGKAAAPDLSAVSFRGGAGPAGILACAVAGGWLWGHDTGTRCAAPAGGAVQQGPHGAVQGPSTLSGGGGSHPN